MRIFIVVSNSRVRGLGYHYAQAFAELGHDVLFHGLEDVAWLTLRGRVVARVKRMKPFLWLTKARQREQLMSAATDFRPDIAIFMGAGGWEAASIRFLKILCSGRVVVMTTDNPTVLPGLRSLEWLEGLAEFETVFVPGKQMIPVFYQLGVKRVELYGYSYNPKIHFPASVSEVDTSISYLGTWGPLQEMWLDRVAAEFQLRIYGWGWQHAARKGRSRASWAKGEGIESEMGAAISSSKITFNMARAEHGCGYSAKTLEIPACGGFMLTNWTEDQAALFEDGKECVYYNTMEEMIEKAKYYLENDGEREKIRRAGMLAVVPHTYKNSAVALLNYMKTGAPSTTGLVARTIL
jgi:spore maturation protein CgeB